MKILKYLLQI